MYNYKPLQDSYELYADIFNKHKLSLDNLSEDIKTFEKHLSELHLLQEIVFDFSSQVRVIGSPEQICRNTWSYPAIQTREELRWNSNEKKLYYAKYETLFRYYGGILEDHSRLLSSSPDERQTEKLLLTRRVIECPVNIRSRVLLSLPEFYNSIAKNAYGFEDILPEEFEEDILF